MNKSYHRMALLALAVCGTAAAAHAQQKQATSPSMADCPMHEKHMAELNDRGGRAMGFDQAKTTHHFRLMPDGGAIDVEANDAKDIASRDQVRDHLKLVTRLFADGDFSKPFAVHAQVPPGVDTLSKLKSAITYTFEESEKGGHVRISTTDPAALKAIHDFLQFQITDHHTGDSVQVKH